MKLKRDAQHMTTEQIQTLNETQKILTLGWIINGIAGYHEDFLLPEQMEPELTLFINEKLNNSMVIGYIGQWQRVWGPFVYLAPYTKYATNAIYVAKKDNQYVIGIAGTNFASIHNWFIEDFYVGARANWAEYAETMLPGPFPPKISMGTKIGLDNLLRQHPGTGKTIIEFFKDELREPGANVEIVVTGHSLGGALSPVLALALYEKKSTWDPNNRATLKVFPFAGPTPGNQAFAEYYRQRLGENTTRVWNSLDIVPHAWSQTKLSQLAALYAPHIPSNPLIEKFVNLAKLISAAGFYTHIKWLTPPLKGTFRPPVQPSETRSMQVELNVQLSESIKSAVTARQELSVSQEDIDGLSQFLTQALVQHIEAYFDLLEFPQELKHLLWPPSLNAIDPEATESMVNKLVEYSTSPDEPE